jgi:hypothetical protein
MMINITRNQFLAFKNSLSEANLSEADLSGADLSKANLSWANLSKADLFEANLSWANLSKADLFEANLSWANLSKADLFEANLRGANLSKADLRGANLSKANLSWADLSKANLSEANLFEANLSKADLREADLRGAKWPLAIQAQVDLGIEAGLLEHIARQVTRSPDLLAMEHWHQPCGTVHCLAGHASTTERGQILEDLVSAYFAGLILLGEEAASHFFDSKENALKFLKTKIPIDGPS